MKKGLIVPLAVAICFGLYIYQSCKPTWQFDDLEKNAKKVITADELQCWATNLLAQYPYETNFSMSELGTNFPTQLRGLAPKLGPHISIHVFDDTNHQPFVQLYWGSGFLGASGFYIGATNFVWAGREWQPGVLFYHY